MTSISEQVAKIKWCVTCGKSVRVANGPIGPHHIVFIRNGDLPTEIDICDGPFVHEPPQDLTEDEWRASFASEPFAEELEQMDEAASDFFVDAE